MWISHDLSVVDTCRLCTWPTCLVGLFIVLSQWNNILRVDMSLHSDTFSWFQSNQSLVFLKTNIFQSKLYTLIYCRHFRTYSRCAMFDWSDTVFRRRNVTRSSKMATIDECIEFALKNIGLWWRYGFCRHCDEWKYIIIGRIFESEIILIPSSLQWQKNKLILWFVCLFVWWCLTPLSTIFQLNVVCLVSY
jgi:hypothetical protein